MTNSIKILGAFGAKTTSTSMTCVQLDESTVIDAGNILLGLGEEAELIDNILLTHSHMDHIADIPFVIDVFFSQRTSTLNIYGTKNTLDNLKKHILNWEIWPDFSQIPLLGTKTMAITLHEIELNKDFYINNIKLKAIKTNHTDGSCGYVVEKNNNAIFFTADTTTCPEIWNEINNNEKINSVIVDVSFTSDYRQLAVDSKHFTPELLSEDLINLKRDNVKIFINHLKPSYLEKIEFEINNTFKGMLRGGGILYDGDKIDIETLSITKNLSKHQRDKQHIDQLIEIGHSLTSENNFDALLEKILLGAKQLSHADGGTLYIFNEESKSLSFKVVQTDSLNIRMGGTSTEITWPDVQLFKNNGHKNKQQVAALCALDGELINIPDVYDAIGFNFEGTKKFDEGTGYRTKSMLVVPMKNHEDDIIGVLQLLNKQNSDGKILEFTNEDENIILSMASQAAVSLTNASLIKDLETLLFDFIKSTADAISEKSKYTGGHINRVAELSTLIATKINADDNGIFKDVHFSDDELRQIDISAWMHDIGKITTPEYIVDKATKLETKYDRINEVTAKFEILKRDVEIDYLKNKFNATSNDEVEELDLKYKNDINYIEEANEFIKKSNLGSEFVSDENIARLEEISSHTITINNTEVNILSDDELYNLSIRKGTLTNEERTIINNHVIVSYNMLKELSFPKNLQRVPVIAGSHHKTIYTDNTGKHGGYGSEEIMSLPMSIEDRILAVADVFEAVTASDRPYKAPNSLNHSLKIMSFMVKDNELDRDIVKFFIDNKIYEDYAKQNLLKIQQDEVTVTID
jgi:HD-GYP domain-containing protein (c-di-GMP phosphodiesterase class II)/phosphoribosyl 1,2-cyclic phosphodiesterase